MRKKEMENTIKRLNKENINYKAKQLMICDAVRSWEEGKNPVTMLRKISNILKGEV